MMDKNKPFDDKLLDGSFNSQADAYQMLSLESTKKDKGSVIRQWRGSRSAFKTHVVCVTDKDVGSLADCKCSYSAVIKKKRKKDDNKYYIEEEGRNLEHNENCVRNSANCPGIIIVIISTQENNFFFSDLPHHQKSASFCCVCMS